MKFDGTGAMVLMVLAAIGLAVLLFYAPRETVTLAAAYFIQILIFAYVYPAGIQSSLILVHESIFLLWIILKKDGGRKFQRIGVQAGLAALLLCLCGTVRRISIRIWSFPIPAPRGWRPASARMYRRRHP